MSYLDNFNVERIDSIPEVKHQLRILKKAIDNNEIGNDSDAYRKPSTGIPPTDLSQEVRNSLLKADNAVPTAISTTYSELKSLRDNSQLIPGCWYRITDYECTTSQAHTKSAGHPFDILVLSTSVNTLSEEARAIQSERDKELQSIYSESMTDTYTRYANEDGNFEGEHYYAFKSHDSFLCLYTKSLGQIPTALNVYIFENINGDACNINNAHVCKSFNNTGDTVDSYTGLYFSNSNLNAWKIWYCLDNDTNRFVWAKDGLYPAYISYSEILNGEHLEFQGVKEFEGNFELFYGTPEQSKRYSDTDANMGWVVRNTGNGTSLAYTNRNTWTGLLEDENISIILIYDNTFDESFLIYSDNVSQESITDEGKGVIYRMIDEWNNNCPYDFKNIMFERKPVIFTNVGPYRPSNYINNHPFGCYSYANESYVKPLYTNIDTINYSYYYTFSKCNSSFELLCDSSVNNNYHTQDNVIKYNEIILCNIVIFSVDTFCANIKIKPFNIDCVSILDSNSINIEGSGTSNLVICKSKEIYTNGVAESIFYGCKRLHIGELCEELLFSYVEDSNVESGSNVMLYNGKVNGLIMHIRTIGIVETIKINDGAHNLTILSGSYNYNNGIEGTNSWVGLTSDNNLRYWNPADPSGT